MALSDETSHSGVTDEMMEQFFADHPDLRPLAPFASGQGATPVGGVEDDDTSVSPSEPSSPPTVPEPAPQPGEGEPATVPEPAIPEPPPESPTPTVEPPTDDFLDLDGTRYPRSQISAAAQFQQHLANDPQLQQLITDYLTGSRIVAEQPALQPAQPVYDPRTDIDLDDPSTRALYEIVRRQNEQIEQLSSGLRTTYDASIQQQQQQINAQYKVAAESFAKDHGLEDDDVNQISQVAARLGVLPQLMAQVDPVTGTPRAPDAIAAFQKALEIAMYQIPEYRDREFRRSVTTMQDEAQKRKLLGAVGGSSGSVARTTTPPRPGSPEAKRAMLAEVGAMLNGEWSDPAAN